MEPVIYHIDVNSAFLSWEAAYRIHHLGGTLDLRDIPSAISGDAALRHGIILAKSLPAKRFGIRTGETIPEAIQKCPSLYMAPPNYGLYQKCSEAFLKILKEYTPMVEQYSIDEAFMDMTETLHLFGTPVDTAHQIKNRIREELGFTVNVGISCNKLLAKMAGELKKPDRVHTLFPEEIPEKMWPLPVSDLFFTGKAATKKLLNLGIHTIGELAQSDPKLLSLHLKKHGETIWAFANGIDCSSVEPVPPPQKGYGNSTTIAFDVSDADTARLVLLGLAETVGTRLRKDHVQAELMSVGIKSCTQRASRNSCPTGGSAVNCGIKYDLSYASHQMILKNPTNITTELYHYACLLFDRLWDKKTPIRHLGIHTGRLSENNGLRQMNLFDAIDFVKLEQLDKTVDSIRKRYGIDAVKRAAFLGVPIDHMEGGVSREKRTVDYSCLEIK